VLGAATMQRVNDATTMQRRINQRVLGAADDAAV
jgi:hypothetical protein